MTDDPTVAATEPSVEGPTSLGGVNYEIGAVIGRGGMGEVVVAHDREIGRDVALKRMRGRDPELAERFLREAKIQARLDHPAIVPVHELGADRDGQPYFTMKRVTGMTLAARIEGGEALQRLLRAFVDVCLAIDFAHARGVVHRDLKPSNIMLGDYGEVYVLDWGLARVLSEVETPATPKRAPTAQDMTQAGAILGTPGYMAPEQVANSRVGAAADVYALGAILFEILTREPLHSRDDAIASTLDKPTASPAARRPDRAIAPELDVACIGALAREPDVRPTTRVLADQIQRYLDGDRDIERRKQLAAREVEAAESARGSGNRSRAIQAAGRALALDPDAPGAAELLSAMIMELPATTPPEVEAEVATVERAGSSERSKRSMRTYLTIWLLAPVMPYLHPTHWGAVIGAYIIATALAALHAINARTARVPWPAFMAGNLALCVLLSQWTGALLVTPLLVASMINPLGSRADIARRPALLYLFALVAMFLPVVLETATILPSTFRFTPQGLESRGNMLVTNTAFSNAVMLALIGGLLVLTCRYAIGVTRARLEAQRHVHLQAWQLRQLLPRG